MPNFDPNKEPAKRPPSKPGQAVTSAFTLGEESGTTDFFLDESSEQETIETNASLSPLDRDPASKLPRLGEYLIEAKIGAGGMGQVFRARHRMMDRHVALKILPRSLANDAFATERFYEEVRTIGKLMHPNIVTAFDAGSYRSKSAPILYLVMELIEGEVLSHRIARLGPMNGSEAISILKQSASALEYAHHQGIVHRDIKPSNMILSDAGLLKILDFGLASFKNEAMASSESKSQILGTVEFMSPEQINAPEKFDPRSDLYSLGATLFYLLVGRPMFSGEVVQTALSQIHRQPEALYEARSNIDLRLDSLYQKLVAKNPANRFQSASELLDKMEQLNLTEPRSKSVSKSASPTSFSGLRLGFETATRTGMENSTAQRGYSAMGIDLGMIHSRVSYIDHEYKVEEILVDGESCELRNMVYSDGESIATGSRAAAMRAEKPNQIFYGMQRWYGLPVLERPFGGKQTPPEVLVASILRELSEAAKRKLPSVSHAILTVPASYDQMHRLSTKAAAAIAGIEVLQLMDKPLAAALSHVEMNLRLRQSTELGFGAAQDRNLLVVMLNGSACESAVVRVEGNCVRMLAASGDCKRGITRWHDRAARKLAAEVEAKLGSIVREDLAIASRLQRTIERVFERLRTVPTVPFIFEVASGKIERQLERDRLHEWVGDLEGDCSLFAQEAMQRAKLEPDQISDVLLLGDVCWMSKIQEQLRLLVGAQTKMTKLKASDVAKGAAIQAKYTLPPIDPKGTIAHAVSNYDLGLIVEEQNDRVGSPKVLMPRDNSVPNQLSKTLRFQSSGNKLPKLQFVEGSRSNAMNWTRLGSVDLNQCFPDRPESDPIQMRLELDASGILSGSLSWLAGNRQVRIPQLSAPQMDIVTLARWRDWLESLILCNTTP